MVTNFNVLNKIADESYEGFEKYKKLYDKTLDLLYWERAKRYADINKKAWDIRMKIMKTLFYYPG